MAIDVEFLKSIGLDDDSLASKIAEKSAADESGLVNKRDELLGAVSKYKSDIESFQSMAEEYERTKAKLSEYEKSQMSEEERLALAREEASKEWEGKYSEAAERLQKMEAMERERVRNEAVFRAVGDKGDAELILDIIAQRGLVESVDKDGEIVLKVHSMSGDKELESVDKLLDEMKSSDRYARLFNSSGLSGGGTKPNQSGGTDGGSKLFGAAKIRAARAG